MQLACDVCRECWNIKYIIQKKIYDKNICIGFRNPGCFGSHLDQGCLHFLMTTLCSQVEFSHSLTASNTLLKAMNIHTPLNTNYVNTAIFLVSSCPWNRALKVLQNLGHLHGSSPLSPPDAQVRKVGVCQRKAPVQIKWCHYQDSVLSPLHSPSRKEASSSRIYILKYLSQQKKKCPALCFIGHIFCLFWNMTFFLFKTNWDDLGFF